MYDNKKLVLEKHFRNNVSAFQSINNKIERMKEGEMPCSESAMPHINPLPYIHMLHQEAQHQQEVSLKTKMQKFKRYFYLLLFSTLVLLVVFGFLIICC